MPRLVRLHLFRNAIERSGAIALGKALHDWALARVAELVLEGNPIDTRALKFVGDALRRREWARMVLHQWRHGIREQRHETLHAQGLRAQRRTVLPAIAKWRVS